MAAIWILFTSFCPKCGFLEQFWPHKQITFDDPSKQWASIFIAATMIIIVYGSILAPPSLYPRKKP
jgi:hypothetical protein